jgi:hypothetical protein
MIKDFDVMKQQLRDLARVLNDFKSEAVQLRVVEFFFQQMGIESQDIEGRKGSDEKQKKHVIIKTKSGMKEKEKRARAKRVSKGGRPGPGAIISQLIAEGFFKKPKLVQDIITHCQSKSGYSYKTSELSVGLVRAVRNKALQRRTNAQNQFEYFE